MFLSIKIDKGNNDYLVTSIRFYFLILIIMILLHEERASWRIIHKWQMKASRKVAQEITLSFKVRGKRDVQDIGRSNRIVRSEKKKVGDLIKVYLSVSRKGKRKMCTTD